MSRRWRQVRVFTSNFGPGWYHEILARIILPWLAQHPDTDFFFSKYLVPLHGNDDADTDPNELVQNNQFLQNTPQGQLHRSVRIRFVETLPADIQALAPGAAPLHLPPAATPKETTLRTLIEAAPQNFWKSDFLDYVVGDDLGGERFSLFPVGMVNERDARGEKVAAVLRANCELVLTLFALNGANLTIESSPHVLNQIIQTPVQSVGHMLANAWFNSEGHSVEVWAFDSRRGLGTKI